MADAKYFFSIYYLPYLTALKYTGASILRSWKYDVVPQQPNLVGTRIHWVVSQVFIKRFISARLSFNLQCFICNVRQHRIDFQRSKSMRIMIATDMHYTECHIYCLRRLVLYDWIVTC